jgi:hypothetical protein
MNTAVAQIRKHHAPPLRRQLNRLKQIIHTSLPEPAWLPLTILADGPAGQDCGHKALALAEIPSADSKSPNAVTSARIWDKDMPTIKPKLDQLGRLGFWNGIVAEFLIEWTVTPRHGLQAVIRDVRPLSAASGSSA